MTANELGLFRDRLYACNENGESGDAKYARGIIDLQAAIRRRVELHGEMIGEHFLATAMDDIATQRGFDPKGWNASVYHILFGRASGPDIDEIMIDAADYTKTERKLGDYLVRFLREKIDSGELTLPARVSA